MTGERSSDFRQAAPAAARSPPRQAGDSGAGALHEVGREAPFASSASVPPLNLAPRRMARPHAAACSSSPGLLAWRICSPNPLRHERHGDGMPEHGLAMGVDPDPIAGTARSTSAPWRESRGARSRPTRRAAASRKRSAVSDGGHRETASVYPLVEQLTIYELLKRLKTSGACGHRRCNGLGDRGIEVAAHSSLQRRPRRPWRASARVHRLEQVAGGRNGEAMHGRGACAPDLDPTFGIYYPASFIKAAAGDTAGT